MPTADRNVKSPSNLMDADQCIAENVFRSEGLKEEDIRFKPKICTSFRIHSSFLSFQSFATTKAAVPRHVFLDKTEVPQKSARTFTLAKAASKACLFVQDELKAESPCLLFCKLCEDAENFWHVRL